MRACPAAARQLDELPFLMDEEGAAGEAGEGEGGGGAAAAGASQCGSLAASTRHEAVLGSFLDEALARE